MDHAFCSMLSAEVGLSILNVDYRLAPENGFPIPTEDCYTALKWVLSFFNLGLSDDRLTKH